jgi:hypothetical protein
MPGATALGNGTVLVTGGYDETLWGTDTAEIFDPTTGTWAEAAPMSLPRAFHNSSLLADGRVLVAGGESGLTPTDSAEIYDPATGTWSSAANLPTARYCHTAQVLGDGRVALMGGATWTTAFSQIASVHIYDPTTNAWTIAATMPNQRYFHSATTLNDGRILVVGGLDNNNTTASADLYDPSTDAWSSAGSMVNARYGHSVAVLGNGSVVVTGGEGDASYLSSVEIFQPLEGTWTTSSSLVAARAWHTASRLADHRILLIGGHSGNGHHNATEIGDSAVTSWTGSNANTPRDGHVAVTLQDSRILIAGGEDDGGIVGEPEMLLPADATTDQTTYAAEEAVTVSYSGMPASAADWVAISPEGSAYDNVTAWQYTDTLWSGSLVFPGLPAGTYRVRLFHGAYGTPYNLVGESQQTFTTYPSINTPCTYCQAPPNF